MADHAEDTIDAPVDHGLCHRVGHRPRVRRLGREPDEHLALAHFNGVGFLPGIFMPARRCAGQRIEIPAVPGAADPAFVVDPPLDRAFAQGAALMRAMVVHCRLFPVEVGQAEALMV